MISSLNGRVLDVNSDHVVMEVGGVGLAVFVPASSRDQMRPGEHVFLFTHMIVRQDLLALYGFETKESREFFLLLLGVDGVGPRLALSVLSTLSPDAIRRAVFHEQPEVFSRVPGVGKKTAQKIVFHLQDRLPGTAGLEPVSALTDVDTEVLSALTALGYSVVEAQASLQSIPRDTPPDGETRLLAALQYFGGD